MRRDNTPQVRPIMMVVSDGRTGLLPDGSSARVFASYHTVGFVDVSFDLVVPSAVVAFAFDGVAGAVFVLVEWLAAFFAR